MIVCIEHILQCLEAMNDDIRVLHMGQSYVNEKLP